MSELSVGEKRLFAALNGAHWIEHVERGAVVAPKVYDLLAIEAFKNNAQGAAAEALRRAIKHFDAGGYRGQSEFENLIGF